MNVVLFNNYIFIKRIFILRLRMYIHIIIDGHTLKNRRLRAFVTKAKSRTMEPEDIILIFQRTKSTAETWSKISSTIHGWIVAPERCSWILPFITATLTWFARLSTKLFLSFLFICFFFSILYRTKNCSSQWHTKD